MWKNSEQLREYDTEAVSMAPSDRITAVTSTSAARMDVNDAKGSWVWTYFQLKPSTPLSDCTPPSQIAV
ncbi:hypothetical protein PsorP6_016102 [Peronosclerospora sorghi]|uniref:Uncharacterized protein n=1 Tax=Peronosclerospora sorghi TaxID=230839 RepID=A0ACC0VLR1_9STRA|nr:hypothetical protein PsorP6_016102 [Peronosclerospora sorghi]